MKLILKPFIFLILLILFQSALTSCSGSSEPKTEKPNIVIFFTDDQGYADVGCYNAKGFETPNMDKLANDGIQFTNFYVPATVCTPSRAGLLTGRYPKRYNLHEGVISPFNDHGLPLEEFTMAEMLKTVGYSTGCIGKWHLGHATTEMMPNNQGFDYYYGVPYSNDMDGYYYEHNDFQSPPLPVYSNTVQVDSGPDQQYLTKMFTEEAIRFIQKEKDNPFLLYLPHCMPHTPLYASENFKGKSELGLYGDVIMELDWSVGEVVKALKESGVYKNTILIFTSDNGPSVGSAKPLRGTKATTWEGGQRVPGIITWAGKIPAGVMCHEIVNTMDLFPTFAQLTGAKIPEGLQLDGENIIELLKDPQNVKLEERPFYYYSLDGILDAVRLGKWKLHIDKKRGWNSKEPFPISLYNLDEDISEKDNLAEKYPEIVEKLREILLEFDASLN
jgi:arylsulfatase A